MTRRILYLIETLGHGGAEHQLVATLKLLDRNRFEPVVCFFRAPDYLAAELTASGIQVLGLEVPKGKQHWPRLAARIRGLARELSVDLIHTSLLEADIVGGLAGRLASVPVVSTLCNIAGDPIRLADNPRNSWLKFAAMNQIWGGALRAFHTHSIAISDAVRASAITSFRMKRERITVIYRGLEPTRPAPSLPRADARRRLGFDDASPLFLSIGRLAPQKGHKHLIAALPTVVRQFPKTKLAIVGEGWLRSNLEAQVASLGLTRNVVFLGKRTDIPELFAACDAFVFPSLFEGLGVSLLEASYAGCACLSTNTGPIPEVVRDGETGLLVPPADSQALASALLRLANDPELVRRLGFAARESALQRFMLPDKVTELEALYSRLLPGPSQRRTW